MEKIVNINQFNGSNYDKILPDNASLTTKQMFGLNENNTTDDVLAWLGKYNTHCWRRRTYTVTIIQNDIQETVAVTGTASDKVIKIAQTFEVSENGTISLVNPTNEGITKNTSGARLLADHAPTYVSDLYGDQNGIYYIPSGANVGTAAGDYTIVYSGSAVKLSQGAVTVKSKKVESQITKGEWESLYSTNRNAYPDSGVSGGYEYEYLGVPFDKLLPVSQIETGSYVGTGVGGSSNPNNLTFSVQPKMVVLYQNNYCASNDNGEWEGRGASYYVFLANTSALQVQSYRSGTVKFAFNGNSVSWYSTAGDNDQNNAFDKSQKNVSGATYYYLVIG